MRSQPSLPTIYVVSFVVASCSLFYELLIAQTLSMLASNTVVWYSLTIGVYLAAMGIGALINDKRPTQHPWERLLKVELALCLVGSLAVATLHFSHTVTLLSMLAQQDALGIIVFFFTAFVMTAVIGLLTGFELPLLIQLANVATKREEGVTNRVLACDYIGSLVAGLSFPILLVPKFDLLTVSFIIASVNLIVAVFALRWVPPSPCWFIARASFCLVLAGSLTWGFINSNRIEQYFAKRYYNSSNHGADMARYFGPLDELEDVMRVRSPYQVIDLLHDKKGYETDFLLDTYSTKFRENENQPRNQTLFLNGDIQFSSSFEEYYHEFFAHLPIAVNGAVPERVLVMGAGDGLLFRELVKYEQIKEIVHVDLDQELVRLAKSHPILRTMNEDAFQDPRIKTTFGDAYNYIRRDRSEFDAIFLDFPDPNDYNLSRLYSREFYYFARKRLAPGGFLVHDAPGLGPRRNRDIYISTLKAAGFAHLLPYAPVVEPDYTRAINPLMEAGYMDYSSDNSRVELILAKFFTSLPGAFVMAKQSEINAPIYWDRRIKRHVFTRERLDLALEYSFPTEEIKPEKVNSVMRPTLPSGSIWKVRKPR